MMDGKRTLARGGLIAALIGVEIFLAHDLTTSSGVVGYTLTKSHAVAPLRRAKVGSLGVQVGAPVAAGQIIATLDATEVDNELEAATADRQRAIAAISSAIAKLHRDNENITRRFETSAERATADLASAEASARTASAELAAVESEIATQKDLVDKHMTTAAVLNALELRRASLAKQVDAAEKVLGILRSNTDAAGKRNSGWGSEDENDSIIAPLEQQLHVAELRIDQLTREKAALILRAPVDGVVDQLPLRPGDLAAPDTPVAIVVATDTQRVVACVPEIKANNVELGMEAEATSAFDHVKATGAVESLTPDIAPLPPRCQPPGSKAVAMGRLAIVALDAPMPGMPGQTQLVRFRSARRAPKPVSTVPAPVAANEPVRMTVPGSLIARSRFEPSGIVWVPALARFVIVSDDTGYKDRDNHAPWLFAMTADGKVDAEPLVVDGIPKLDDLESIALDGDGALWVLSSQSINKKGKRKDARRLLVRIAVERGELRATGSVAIADLLDKASDADRKALGIGDTRALDIEAMTWHDGALYVGLKAPVDADEKAMIWKIAAPAKLLAGDLSTVSLWTRVATTVEADGRSVPGGLADILFVGDRLLFTATASGMDPAVQSSVLYVAKAVAGELKPTKVRVFNGLKAEGLAVSPHTGKLAVVFDRGSEAGMWQELALDEVK